MFFYLMSWLLQRLIMLVFDIVTYVCVYVISIFMIPVSNTYQRGYLVVCNCVFEM